MELLGVSNTILYFMAHRLNMLTMYKSTMQGQVLTSVEYLLLRRSVWLINVTPSCKFNTYLWRAMNHVFPSLIMTPMYIWWRRPMHRQLDGKASLSNNFFKLLVDKFKNRILEFIGFH